MAPEWKNGPFAPSRCRKRACMPAASEMSSDASPFLRSTQRTCNGRRAAASLPSGAGASMADRKSTRLNSSHVRISYAVFGLKKKNEMPALLALNNDLVTTLPLQVADMQAEAASLVVLEPPCKIPSFESTMAWSPLLQHHSAH